MIDIIIGVVITVVIVISGTFIYRKKRTRKLKTANYQERWRAVQKLCAHQDTWRQAVINADKLFETALRKKGFTGKSMGERLTKAQRILSDNEGAWYGHKLRTKLEAEPDIKLKEADVKQALVGIRQALKDLGALPNDK